MKHIHLIGIGGSGLSAIAWMLVEKGYTVSGSDRVLSPLAANLQAAGVRVETGHKAENIQNADLVVRSSAVADDNPEVIAAKALGIPVLKRSEFLGNLMDDKQVIAVAGTHGKTTTSAMISWMLTALGQDPSYIVGGVLQNLNKNAHAGTGQVFVIEADEYDRMFLGLNPNIIVLTSVDHDHPDCFPTSEEYQQAFFDFVSRLSADGSIVVCVDNPGAEAIFLDSLNKGKRCLTYALHTHADVMAADMVSHPGRGFTFTVIRNGEPIAQINLQVPGEHNVQNALAAVTIADLLGLPILQTAKALETFMGTGRRFEVRGMVNGITIVDDYAHHPNEIKATLAAARQLYPESNLWVVWQPHTYSRTKTLLNQYAQIFRDAYRLFVTEIYAAREMDNDFSSAQVLSVIQHPEVTFAPDFDELSRLLIRDLRRGDVVLVLSAGDADQISSHVLAGLKADKDSMNERMGE